MRLLGIPTVVDRLIQQATHQVPMPLLDPGFSEASYGFRPGRSAHDAVLASQAYIAGGRRFVADLDLEKFFDRVNHDVLMARVACKVGDTRVLRLIRRYLQPGLMLGGLTTARTEETPQGGPLSPLLSNILLDDLDKELEGRGHAFCRYAEDCNIYVRTGRAGERVMSSMCRFLAERLRLTVNLAKSAVDRPWKRSFLGFSVTPHREPRLKVAAKSMGCLREKLRDLFRQGRGHSIRHTAKDLAPDPARLDELLPAGADQGNLRGSRRMAAAEGSLHPVAPMEATAHPSRAADATRAEEERAWASANNERGPLERRGQPHERCLPKVLRVNAGLIPGQRGGVKPGQWVWDARK